MFPFKRNFQVMRGAKWRDVWILAKMSGRRDACPGTCVYGVVARWR